MDEQQSGMGSLSDMTVSDGALSPPEAAPIPAEGFLEQKETRKVADAQLEGPRGGVVMARGTGDGLVIRLDGRVDGSSLKEALIDFLNSRKGFLAGNEVALEWVGALPASALIGEISALLDAEFGIQVKSSALWEQPSRSAPAVEAEDGLSEAAPRNVSPRRGEPAITRRTSVGPRPIKPVTAGRAPSLFDGIEVFSGVMEDDPVFADEVAPGKARSDRANLSVDGSLWDDPNARIIYATVRSGQKIETEHSLVIFGDVNSGAELIAGGDIVVLGTLRGTAHAGAYDETGGGRVIFALNLQPTQLRIGMTISRGSNEMGDAPELARVEGSLIVVEPYSSRQNWGRRR